MSAAGAHWAKVLRDHWGLEAELVRLGGEVDENWAASEVVLKVMHVGAADELVHMQVAAAQHCAAVGLEHAIAACVPDGEGRTLIHLEDLEGVRRAVWLQRRLPGRLYADVPRHTPGLQRGFGEALARLDRALESFEHAGLQRELKWDLQRAAWIGEHLHEFEGERRACVEAIHSEFVERVSPALAKLPKQAIHGDANDYNVLVHLHEGGERIGIIDFGDAVMGPALCDLAIAAAYVVLDQPRPFEALAHFVAGYDAERSLSEEELELVWPCLLARLAVSVTCSALAKKERPDDPYVVISEAPAWRFLDAWANTPAAFVNAKLREACGREPSEARRKVVAWLSEHRTTMAPVVEVSLDQAPQLDLSVAGTDAPLDPLDMDLVAFEASVAWAAGEGEAVLGRYDEARLVYGGRAFRTGDHPVSDRRTVHLGIDLFLPAKTPVHAPLASTVHSVQVWPERYDYGGVVTLQHEVEGTVFHTLYGHLDPAVAEELRPGQRLEPGEAFARLGDASENGGWPPHLHLQAGILDRPADDWPGVAFPDDASAWLGGVFFDPAPLLGLEPGTATAPRVDQVAALKLRRDHAARNLKLSYSEPLLLMRGWKNYLFDARGRTYLDAFNNVPHVGHGHPRLVEAARHQASMLNTNTRYVHPGWGAYAEALLERLPDHLDVCFFLNSASEANELALRLARAATGERDVIVSEHGYHGHTSAATDLSHYKWAGPGGAGRPDWVHVAPVPDTFRGEHKADDPEAGPKYAAAVGRIAADLREQGRGVAAFISEPFPSVGGQLVPPPGYLQAVYGHVREAGGLCIADEVQTGLGRLGRHFWGFEQQGARPDVVVLGKPIGNGHPLAALVTTRAIADSLPEGMEFFSTFGGSTVSCAVGLELLRVLDDEQLPENAAKVGDQLMAGYRGLKERHACIGDVRGLGFFMGIELVEPDGSPATALARRVVDALKERRILIGSDGPHDNVLKIRPPMCFSAADAEFLLDGLAAVFEELDATL